MIIINLLPHELRPIKRTPIPYMLSAICLCVALAAMAWLFLIGHTRISTATATRDAKQVELNKLAEVQHEYDQLNKDKIGIRDTVNVIKEILSDRIIWSKQLHRLAELTPENIWYSRIRVTSQTIQERQIKIDPKTRKPLINKKTKEQETELKRIKVPVLEVSGYVINDANGESRIAPLTESTEKDPDFSSMFTLNRPQLEDTEFNGYAVRGFKLEYLITKSVAEEEPGE